MGGALARLGRAVNRPFWYEGGADDLAVGERRRASRYYPIPEQTKPPMSTARTSPPNTGERRRQKKS